MTFSKLFPCVVAACFTLGIASSAAAQKSDTRPTQTAPLARSAEADELEIQADEPKIVSMASAEDIRRAKIPSAGSITSPYSFESLMTSAIDERLGARYRWGATGPSTFDCSGFVWSIFQQAGINFERASARTLWSRFEAPSEDEKYKFGTLVFFSNLAHVGVVADEHGFYHASRRHGVIYSTFSDYWLKRLDGFRKVPTTAPVAAD
jgi:cell wall-associated NlpC family hydrolase